MKLPKSKLGFLLAAVYVFIAGLIFIYARFACSADALYCGMLGFIPVLPSLLLLMLLKAIFLLFSDSLIIIALFYGISLLINAVLVYFVGSFIQNKFSQKITKIISLLALIIAVIVMIILGIRYINKSDIWKPNIPANVNNQINSGNYCQQDSDCVLMSQYQGCCPNGCKEAVNIETKKSEEEIRNIQCGTKEYDCSAYKCPSSVYKQAVCEQNRCVNKEKTTVNANSDIKIFLDHKESYQREQTIQMTIKNDSPIKLFIQNIAVEKYQENENKWTLVSKDIESSCGATSDKLSIFLPPDDLKYFYWRQETDEVLVWREGEMGADGTICKKADLGLYRMKIDYLDDARVGAKLKLQTLYSEEFKIVDNLTQPTLKNYKVIGSFTSPGESSFVKVLGATAFLTDISEGLLAIDVSNPEKPVLLDKIKIAGGGAYALALEPLEPNGPFAVVSGYGNTKVALVDIRDPKNLRIMDEIEAKRSVQDMVAVVDKVYLAIDGPEVEILTLKFTESIGSSIRWLEPTLILKSFFQIQEGGHAIGLAVLKIDKGDSITYNLIIAQGESGVGVYEKAEFIMPQFSFASNVDYVNTVAADENYVYAGVGNAIKVIDLKTQKEIADIKVDDVWNFKVKDNTLYVASGENGVQVLDISDIKNPKQIAVIDTPGRARSIDVSIDGKYIYVADDRDDLQIIGL